MSVLNPPAQYPRSVGRVRPFRIWDANARKPVRWRYYMDLRRAHMGALIECRWGKVGQTYEVYDSRYGKLKGQYTRRLSTVEFLEA